MDWLRAAAVGAALATLTALVVHGVDPVVDRGGAVAAPAHPVRPARAANAPAQPGAAAAMCFGLGVARQPDDDVRAADIMAGRLVLVPHGTFSVPADPGWGENPFEDANWRYQYNNLGWVDVLRRVGARTRDTAMLARWEFLLRDWLRDNPPDGSPSPEAWMDMAVGVRAVILSCAIAHLGPSRWLASAVQRHAAALTDPAQYTGKGNHSMHQNNGLLALGCAAGRPAWRRMALERNVALLERAVDRQGVTNEGAVAYQGYNHSWWNKTRDRIRRCGLTPSRLFARVEGMDDFLTYATAPDGRLAMLGDTAYQRAGYRPGHPSEYAATGGRSGPRPAHLVRVYRAGYAFGRSGWGERRPLAHEDFWTLRFGKGKDREVHGHDDQGSFTLAAHGARLIWDQGLYAYSAGAMRGYVASAAAHNGVTVDGAIHRRDVPARLVTHRHTPAYSLLTVEVRAQPGIRWLRTFFYSKRGRYVLVDDRVTQTGSGAGSRTMTQRFHLGADRAVVRRPGLAATSGPGANVTMFWVGPPPEVRVVKGQRDPLLGWRSLKYKEALPVPVVEARLSGPSARFTTVVVPRPAGAVPSSVGILHGRRTAAEAMVTVRSGSVVESVRVSARGASVTSIPARFVQPGGSTPVAGVRP